MSTTTKRLAKLRRVQDLFEPGKAAVVSDATNSLFEPFWLQKPNAFERDEATKDARAARARRVLTWDRDQDSQDIIEHQILDLTVEEKINGLIANRASEFYVKAADEIRTHKDWTERIEALDRGQSLLDEDGDDADPAEVATVTEVSAEYYTELIKVQGRFATDAAQEYRDMDEVELAKAYREAWRETVGTEAFMTARRDSELFYAIRMCEATPVVEMGNATPIGWDHAKCDHRERMLAERADVHGLPDAVLLACANVLNELQMSPAEAGNSGAPTTSSGSSEQPNVVEDSPASTQTEMSPEPAGT